jgi:hypothetical protein
MQAVVVHERRVVVHASHAQSRWNVSSRLDQRHAMVLREWGQDCPSDSLPASDFEYFVVSVEPISWMAGLVIGFGIST